MQFTNIENHADYCFSFATCERPIGISAMLRVKNEESTIRASILSCIETVDEVVVIDNCSSDHTAEIVEELALAYGSKITTAKYPFTVSNCGYDFANTPENSVKSLAYYYNWCKSKCRYSYLLKWDADMILPTSKISNWKKIRDCVLNSEDVIYQPVGRIVVLDESRIFRDSELSFRDPRLYPNTPDYYYVKAKGCFTERISYQGQIFETCKSKLNMMYSEEPDYYEIKDTRKNEFDHFGENEVNLEVKQSREHKFLETFSSTVNDYKQITDDPYLNLVT